MEQPLGFENLFNKDVLEAIGILFVTAAGAETVTGLHLLRVLSYPRPLDLGLLPATAGMEMKVRLGIIRVRSAQICPAYSARISKITTKIQDAFEHRNNIAHNVGLPVPSKGHIRLTILSFKGDGSLRSHKVYSAKQIRLFSYLMQERLKELNRCLTEAGFPPIPEQF